MTKGADCYKQSVEDTTIIKIALNKFYIFKENDLTVRFKAFEEARVTDEGKTSGQVRSHVSGHGFKGSKVFLNLPLIYKPCCDYHLQR